MSSSGSHSGNDFGPDQYWTSLASKASELAGTTYRDRKLRPKLVRYWAMAPFAGDPVGQHEVDKVAWLSPDSAAGKLSYERDRDVLASLDRVL